MQLTRHGREHVEQPHLARLIHAPDLARHHARRFQAARDRLIRIDHILGDKYTRRELARVTEEELRDFQRLYHDVEQKELVYNRYEAKGREAILSFDFEKAARIYSTLETEFPSDINVEMLARLRRAERPELLAVIDWEMATIGDPLTDLGLFLMFWGPRRAEPPAGPISSSSVKSYSTTRPS